MISRLTNFYRQTKMPADNEGFGVRRGVVSWDTSQDFGGSPPVRTLPIPPPDAKLLKRWLQAEDNVQGHFGRL